MSNSIQQRIDWGHTMHVYCHNPKCQHRSTLDLLKLRDRLGPDHGALSDDLMPHLVCSKCGGRKIGLIYGPDSYETAAGRAAREAREGR